MSSLLSGAAIDFWWISTNVVFYDNINEIAFNGWFPGLPIQSLYTVCAKVSDRWCELHKNCDTTKLANLCSWYFYLPCVTFFKEVTSLVRIGTDRGWHHHWNRDGEKYLLILAVWPCVFSLEVHLLPLAQKSDLDALRCPSIPETA